MTELVWDEKKFQPVLNAGEGRMHSVMTPNAVRYTVALLRLLRGGKSPSAQEVVDYVRANMAPQGGWVGFSNERWMTYHDGVVAALSSDKPLEAFKVLSKRP